MCTPTRHREAKLVLILDSTAGRAQKFSLTRQEVNSRSEFNSAPASSRAVSPEPATFDACPARIRAHPLGFMLNRTVLRLLGLDDDRLRYSHNGRQMQLSQFGGQVIKEILNL